jgi:tRNA pseudouridine55 synthase
MTLFGLLNVHKPSGKTSRDVVNQIQRLVRPAKIGHAGTLDPLASGVLVIGLGQATRLVEYVQQMPKQYRATFLLGRTSTTEDIEGTVTVLMNAPTPTRTQLDDAAGQLTGKIDQRPPAFSALKVDGRRAYALARAGETFELAPRIIEVRSLEIIRYEYPELVVDVECGSGTYVRSLGRDLAELVGTGAVMSALVRTAIGPFKLDRAIDPGILDRNDMGRHLLPAVLALCGLMSQCVVSDEEVKRLSNGMPIAAPAAAAEECAAVDREGKLVAILRRRPDGQFGPVKFFPAT